KARENFQAMMREGWLLRDPRPAYYVYRLGMDGHVQTGLVGAASVADYREGRIKRHEHTRPDKEDDRMRHAEAIGAQAGPVFLAYRGRREMDTVIAGVTERPPEVAFTAVDGVSHALWVVDETSEVARFDAALRDVPETYIADGHHRAAAYARVAENRHGEAG